MKLRTIIGLLIAAAITLAVGVALSPFDRTDAPGTPLQEFARTIDTFSVVTTTEDLTERAQELFPAGADPQPFVDELKASGFRVTFGDRTTGELLKQGKFIFCSKERGQVPFIASKEHRIVFYLDGAGRIRDVGSWLFSTWI